MVIRGGGGVSQRGPSEEEKTLNEPMKAVAREPDAMNTPLREHKNTNHGSACTEHYMHGGRRGVGRTEPGNVNPCRARERLRVHTRHMNQESSVESA